MKLNPGSSSLELTLWIPFQQGQLVPEIFFEEFLTIDHWNIAPYPSYIGVKDYIGAGFSFGTRLSFNSIKQYGDTPASDNYYNVDGIVSYNLSTLFKGKTLMPFLEVVGDTPYLMSKVQDISIWGQG